MVPDLIQCFTLALKKLGGLKSPSSSGIISSVVAWWDEAWGAW